MPETTSIPSVFGAKEYEALPFGAPYLDPEGVQRKKPFKLSGSSPDEMKSSYALIPEGESYVTPDGVVRLKPAYEGVDFTTQTLYDMAPTDKERRNVLERVHGPEAVKGEGADLYVETPAGKRLKPGAGSTASRAASLIAAEAAPVGGAIAGEIAGAAAGTAVEPGAGTFVGAVGGGYVGGAAGQAFNDMVLKLAGVHDRSAAQETRDIAAAGLGGGAGTSVGRAVSAGAPAAKEVLSQLGQAAPRAFAKIAGATEEGTAEAARLTAKGAKVPPSSWLPELPYVHKTVETFDPAFRKQDVLRQSAEKFYGNEAGKVLDQLGVPASEREPLTAATAKVSSEKAGQMSIDRVRVGLQREDAALDAAVQQARDAARAAAGGGSADLTRTIDGLKSAAASNREMAQTAIDEGFNMIRADADAALKAVGVHENPGDAVRQFAGKVQTLRTGIRLRASKLYDAADAAAGPARPDVSPLKEESAAFLESLPEPFRQKYPDIVKQIAKLESGQTTFGQLHNLRSMLRQDVEYGDLTPSMRDGVFKHFSGKIDEVLKSGKDATLLGTESSELRAASDMLDKADAFYAKNMPRFQDEKVRGIVEAVKAGMPMDADILAREVMQPGYTERMTELRKIAGKPLWAAVQAADTKSMIESSRTLVPGEVNGGQFASQVLDRYKTGVLEAGYDKATADKLMAQAQRMLAADGKIPVKALPGDTVVSMLRKADEYLAEAEKMAATDPLGTLSKEISRIDKDHRASVMALSKARRDDPLNFLFNANAGPVKSADKILGDPDLMTAAARRFGEDSPEFTALRQVYAHRLLQRSVEDAGALSSAFQKITPEVQAVVFPGVTLDNAKQLAKDMDFLVGKTSSFGDAGGSMAAASRVLHPWGTIGRYSVSLLPGADTAGRLILGNYYKLMSWGSTHPVFINWVAKGLQGGSTERATARQAVQRVLSSTGGDVSGAVGAGAGEALQQVPE